MSATTLKSRYATACRNSRFWRHTFMPGLPVGLLQAVLNQGDHWWRHDVNAVVIAKSILSPVLSCAIAFSSAVAARTTSDSSSNSS